MYDLGAASSLADTKLGTRAGKADFLKSLQAKSPLFNGAELIDVAGHPTVRLLNLNEKMEPNIDPTTQSAHWTPAQAAELEAAAHAAAAEQGEGFETQSRVFGAEPITSFNNWKESPNGEAHLSRFSQEGRSDFITRLEGPLRKQAAGWIKSAFAKHAPRDWDIHFGTATPAVESAAGGELATAGAGVGIAGPYKPAALGTPSSPDAIDRGWVLGDGSGRKLTGTTHQENIAQAAGVPLPFAMKQYPALAAKGNLIRIASHVYRPGLQLIAEIFTAPTDAQIGFLSAWDKANQSNHLYDGFHFALTDPLTKQTVYQGTGVNNIRRAVKDTNFDIPF